MVMRLFFRKRLIFVLIFVGLNVFVWADADTDLTTAIVQGNSRLFNDALNRGANVNRVVMDGAVMKTPLTLAAKSGNIDFVQKLIEKGASLEVASGVRMESPLVEAIRSGNVDIVGYLLERGAGANTHSLYGNTPLHYAVGVEGSANLPIVNRLMRGGAIASSSYINENGDTPFMIAIREKQTNVIQAFITNQRFDVVKPDENGTPPILIAIKLNIELNLLRTMLQMATLPPADIMDFSGQNAYDYVRSFRGNNSSYIRLLDEFQRLKGN
jgi:ankyrin repeat protein